MSSVATRRIGTAHATSTKTPKIMLPNIAPNRAAANVIDIAVDLKKLMMTIKFYVVIFENSYLTLVGKSSAPKQSRALNPIVETAPKIQDSAKLPALLRTSQMRKAANPEPIILKTKNRTKQLYRSINRHFYTKNTQEKLPP